MSTPQYHSVTDGFWGVSACELPATISSPRGNGRTGAWVSRL
ncbi:MAG TPA: hypothetical protein VLV28_08695 [Gaiellaceae bacterium]|nr:hypothetical protein [Gaiellaceae bacterium]